MRYVGVVRLALLLITLACLTVAVAPGADSAAAPRDPAREIKDLKFAIALEQNAIGRFDRNLKRDAERNLREAADYLHRLADIFPEGSLIREDLATAETDDLRASGVYVGETPAMFRSKLELALLLKEKALALIEAETPQTKVTEHAVTKTVDVETATFIPAEEPAGETFVVKFVVPAPKVESVVADLKVVPPSSNGSPPQLPIYVQMLLPDFASSHATLGTTIVTLQGVVFVPRDTAPASSPIMIDVTIRSTATTVRQGGPVVVLRFRSLTTRSKVTRMCSGLNRPAGAKVLFARGKSGVVTAPSGLAATCVRDLSPSRVAPPPTTSTSTTATGHYSCNSVPPEKLFHNDNGFAVSTGGAPPTFSTQGKAYCVTSITTYHWNNGHGQPPGTIGLTGTTAVAPQKATGQAGQNNVANANWTVNFSTTSNPAVIDGTYSCKDSSPATWSQNSESKGEGFCIVWAVPATRG